MRGRFTQSLAALAPRPSQDWASVPPAPCQPEACAIAHAGWRWQSRGCPGGENTP